MVGDILFLNSRLRQLINYNTVLLIEITKIAHEKGDWANSNEMALYAENLGKIDTIRVWVFYLAMTQNMAQLKGLEKSFVSLIKEMDSANTALKDFSKNLSQWKKDLKK